MTPQRYSAVVPRQKVTLYLDPDVLRQLRVAAARRGVKDSDLVEEAVKEHIGIAAWERVRDEAAKHPPLSQEEAMELALEVTHQVRRERREQRNRRSA
jgi:hypothetical protein